MVSKYGMGTMDKETQAKIKESISKTEFGSIEKLRIMLKTMMKENAQEDSNIARLDAGKSLRPQMEYAAPAGYPGSPVAAPISVPARARSDPARPVTNPESAAILHFRAKAAGLGSNNLPMHEAWDALTQALKTMKVNKQVSEEEFDDMFMEISDDDEVAEKPFLAVFKRVIKNASLIVDEDEIKREFSDIFKAKLGSSGTYKRSARVLYKAFEKMQKEGKMKGIKLLPETRILEIIEKWDQDKDGRIDVDEFTDAALIIVRDSTK